MFHWQALTLVTCDKVSRSTSPISRIRTWPRFASCFSTCPTGCTTRFADKVGPTECRLVPLSRRDVWPCPSFGLPTSTTHTKSSEISFQITQISVNIFGNSGFIWKDHSGYLLSISCFSILIGENFQEPKVFNFHKETIMKKLILVYW
jgi:hypothetical protein